ncbi:hypothetical protein ARMSODRAFT_915929 [Armillaria solidipes]|uniref:Uncharacterized protein n=1 Tax=Armillaria solidipes TaxID=1076256 RepID=A0A2H3BVA8_9AGAR|nr:hypothetical protein ARMSODRAFT_915929 [Armillaria solidipes]
MESLPSEILSAIFTLAADEDVLFHHVLPTSMAGSVWFRNTLGLWSLRSPGEALNALQRRSYSTKKSIILTCKTFHRVGYELFFHCLFFNGPSKLTGLCAILDSNKSDPSPGWWTKRLHLTSYSDAVLSPESANALSTIIRHCPNLEIMVMSFPASSSAFMPVADTISTYVRRTIHTLNLNIPVSSLSKLIWMLSSLPLLTSAHFSFRSLKGLDDEDNPPLGAAESIVLSLPRLTQLSLYGNTAQFLEQTLNWTLPSLRVLSLNTFQSDILPVLDVHGSKLTLLDVTCSHPIAMDLVLQRCPSLETVCFNADWRIEGQMMHDNVRDIGLHGLSLAFTAVKKDGVSQLALLDSMIRRANDANFTAVLDKANFPKLARMRVLSPNVLTVLEKNGGPESAPPNEYGYIDELEDGLKRWERWWDMCYRAGVRLEDCTGGVLGDLPAEEEDEDEEDEDEDEEEDEDLSWEYEVPPMEQEDTSGVGELRKLIEECRQMELERDTF